MTRKEIADDLVRITQATSLDDARDIAILLLAALAADDGSEQAIVYRGQS